VIEQEAKILIVDDDPTNLNILVDYLYQLGYRVLIAPDGEQALRQIEHVLPDLILLDVMMPGLDGFEICRRLKARESTRDIPIIFMTALSDPDDKIEGFMAGGVDYITKPFHHKEVSMRVKTHVTLRRLQQELQQKNQRLQEVNASKDKFFSIVAHDLRSPLGALRELPGIILGNIENYSREDLVALIMAQRDATQNVYALMENLLTWARIQRGHIEFLPQSLELEPLVTQNIELLRLNAQQKQIALHNRVPSVLRVHADYHILNAILRNLISNAIKFTKAQGMITVSATPIDPLVTVSVADTGIGIAPEQISKIFRIDTKFKRRGTAGEQGTGLGLILCQEFVEKHQGTLNITSQPGQGTTVTFTLPRSLPPIT
jgi:signal transduction histidine kinase